MTVCKATLTELEPMGPGLLRVRLEPGDPAFSFVAGQWIDLGVDIDGEQVVAGYSPSSSPSQRDFFELGVRLGRTNRVSQWFHHQAEVGDQVTISGGHGKCIYEPAQGDVLTLVGGGIGLTPLLSMLYAFSEHPETERATLYLSVSQREQTPFEAQLDALAKDERIAVHIVVPAERPGGSRLDAAAVLGGGATVADTFYLCGPPEMIDAMSEDLARAGVPRDRVRYEKWW